MPKKPPPKSTRRNMTVGRPPRVINVPSLKRAPKAVSPRPFKTFEEAEAAQRKLGRQMMTRSGSAMAGTTSPGGAKRKPKKSRN